MQPDSKDAIEQARIEALEAISRIPLRTRPENIKPYAFSDEFRSDVEDVLRFCRNRSPYARSPRYIERNSDATFYITNPYYVFYLPGILLTALEFPNGQVAWGLVYGFSRRETSFAIEEKVATNHVIKYLALRGLTLERIEARVRRGQQIGERHRQLIDSGVSEEEVYEILWNEFPPLAD